MFKIIERTEPELGDCVRFKVKCSSCSHVSAIPSHHRFFECENELCENYGNLWEMRENRERELRTELAKLLGE